MKDNANTQAARQKAKALARWEGEGGALGPPRMTLDETDLRILARLGAALLVERGSVSEAARGEIFATASTLHAKRDAGRIKGEIARFLDAHENP